MPRYALGATPRVHCGPGARSELVSLLQAGTRDILLVTDRGIESAGVAERVRNVLPETTRVETAYAPSHEPTVADIDNVADQARGLAEPVIIAVGGGTVLDTAKLVAALQPLNESAHAYLLGAGNFSTRLPSLMVPTTSGTGSEGTRTCIVTDSHDRKCWIFGDVLLPDAIVLDPELTTGLPVDLTLATGIDAFVHAFEAASAQAANAVSRAQGLHAIRVIAYLLLPLSDQVLGLIQGNEHLVPKILGLGIGRVEAQRFLVLLQGLVQAKLPGPDAADIAVPLRPAGFTFDCLHESCLRGVQLAEHHEYSAQTAVVYGSGLILAANPLQDSCPHIGASQEGQGKGLVACPFGALWFGLNTLLQIGSCPIALSFQIEQKPVDQGCLCLKGFQVLDLGFHGRQGGRTVSASHQIAYMGNHRLLIMFHRENA